MAAVSRQPFAPLDGARLQSLTSLKNRQNTISSNASSGKRKADLLDTDDFENVDPLLFAKRSKGASSGTPSKDILKPSNFILTTKASTPITEPRSLIASPTKASSTPRRALQPKSPIGKLNTKAPKSSPVVAPAGRSPTRSKRSGILSSRRRTAGPYTRIDPPSFDLDSSAPFSLDAALKGTISSYGSRSTSTKKPALSSLLQPEAKASWFFDIHEDTPEQEMTNLLQHGTCVLDISSDEESEQRARRDAEGRDKENIPPVDDVSQTSTRRSTRQNPDEMVIEKERVALGEMNAADFYPEGCDETSIIFIPEDDEPEQENAATIVNDQPAPELEPEEPELEIQGDIDALMSKSNGSSSKAAVLQPIEGTGESFELWESDSTKDEAEMATSS